MNRALLYKFLVVAFLMLLLLIPLKMVGGLVDERGASRDEAVSSVWGSYAGPQTLTGPVLVVPYTETTNVADPQHPDQWAPHAETKQLLVFPATLNVKSDLTPDERYRGIYKVLVYEMRSQWNGTLELPDLDQLPQAPGHVGFTIGKPYVAIGISDIRGLTAVPALNFDGHALTMERGARLSTLKQGLSADVDLDLLQKGAHSIVSFSMTLPLLGAHSLAFTPVAGQNDVTLSSNWLHPGFDGTFPPRARNISDKGFDATWSVTSYNTKARDQIAGTGGDEAFETMAVTLVDPVNVYVQTNRAVKYGGLFVLLTFAGFFMFELVKRLRIHPIQYLLVGLALALFFLLLLSLSEHMAFLLAYLVASAACIGLLSFYLSFVLHGGKRGISFGVLLGTLYAALYGLLQSEDNALILGSALLFAILAAIMVLTRRIDWYAVGDAWQPLREASAAIGIATPPAAADSSKKQGD